MLQPIQKEHEMCCPSCGCVLAQIDEYHELNQRSMPATIDLFLLGSAFDKTQYTFRRTRQQLYEESVLRKLIDVTKTYALPERLAYETFKELKRKRRGFRSEKEPIKQLLQILSKDENYLHIHILRALRARYADLLSG